MSLDVTSNFRSQMESTRVTSIVNVFTLAGSNFSSHVLEYGTISRDATEIVGGDFKVTLQNASQLFNDFHITKTQFLQAGIYDFGFSTDSGTNDTEQLFGGVFSSANYKESLLTISLKDKLVKLKDKKIGSDKTPVSFTNTNVSAADLGWWLATSFGGLSAVESTSNPDINYAKFLEWQAVIDNDTTLVQANFTGEDVTEALDILQRLTDSVIYVEGDNKVYFNKWSGVSSEETITLSDSDTIGGVRLDVTADSIVNRVNVLVGFNVSSNTWDGEILSQNSASVNSFGLQELIFDSETIWYPNSISAINLAERIVYRRSDPNRKFRVPTPLKFLDAQIGDEVAFTTRVYSINDETFNLQGYEINTETKEMELKLDEGFGRGSGRLRGFVLDNSSWGLLDQNYNPLL